MAEINRSGLVVTRGPKLNGDEATPSARQLITDQAPKVRVLANSRMLGAQQILSTVGEFNPNRVTMKQREQMRRDPMIQMGLHYIRVPLIAAPYHFECDDPVVAEFVKRCYDRIHTRLMNCLLSALEFGYAGTVKRFQLARQANIDVSQWKYTDQDSGKESVVWPDTSIDPVIWNEPRPLPPRGLHPMFNEVGEDKFIGMRHDFLTRDVGVGEPLEVDAEHSSWFTNERDQSFGDWYGYPRTGYALRYWWSYWYNWLLGDRHFEQDADPPLVVKVPEGESVDPDDKSKMIPNTEVGLRLGQYLRDGATIAIPSTPYTGEDSAVGPRGHNPEWDVAFLRGGENMKAFQDRFEYLDVMKLRAILVPEQALIEGKGGTSSRNVAATFGAVFAAAQELLSGDCDQHINDYWIPDLVRQNFVNAPECTKVTTGFREEDMTLVTAILTAAATNDLAALKINFEKLLEANEIPTLTPEGQAQAEAEAARRAAAQAPPPGATPPGAPAAPGAPGGGPPAAGGGRGVPPAPGRAGRAPGGGAPTPPAAGGGGITIDGQPLAASLELADLGHLPDIEPYADPQIREVMVELYDEVERVLSGVYGTHDGHDS